ncbi:group II intron reverse transcriptase/maturase [Methanoplanus endosymbiosus]|uniref:Group II intron reverse transcriptase/maturase n=1 Tax=Methanoplanus endosymbiosus TaxID=33865 RepID=A0A9E7PQ99_9EURY|nr:group II intron reverse transcriptase/maturase [Methanoplanus endosymbiosus]UUX93011.1 group II intron reverse transcriptase/maturase [Methanoplanus endosymbiosus]
MKEGKLMKVCHSTTHNCEKHTDRDLARQWNSIDWDKTRDTVNRLQIRIAKATKEENWNLVKRLSYLLTHSRSAKLVAVRIVTQNRGKRTPGIDGEIWNSASAKMQAVLSLTDKNYCAKPLRRIYIPKPGKNTKRPISIPSMYDRAMQALYGLALQPIAETTADPRSFGFRLFRSAQDASEYAFTCLGRKTSSTWILEGDIRGCFDNINHEWLKEHIPMDQSILKQFLKSGFVFDNSLFPTDKGTPQGGIVSPILANMTLDGIEHILDEQFQNMKVHFIRYADDFLVTAPTEEIAKEAKEIIKEFLAIRGLELSEEKTLITHINNGFDFLGYNFRKYKGKLLIKPSEKSIKSITDKIRTKVKKARAWSQEELIKVLNPTIRGWVNYHRHNAAKETFQKLDHYLWTVTWKWGKRRHTNKGRKWVASKYWHVEGKRKWVFKTEENTLIQFSEAPIRRHSYPKLNANPYLDRKYFLKRKDRMRRQTPWFQTKLSYFALSPVNG